tara:strand:+ start:633 stop:1178 length:546 start_codon:yes stop_codon:yes gene_type:complete
METTKNTLTEFQKSFINSMKSYLNTKIYFYGSIQRLDYFPMHSDIDIDIFANDVKSMSFKLREFLKNEKSDYKNFVYRLLKQDNYVAKGIKASYINEKANIRLEISIYNIKDKKNILQEHNAKTIIPLYASALLYFLKYLYYVIPLLPRDVYAKGKSFLMHEFIGDRSGDFLVVDNNNNNK